MLGPRGADPSAPASMESHTPGDEMRLPPFLFGIVRSPGAATPRRAMICTYRGECWPLPGPRPRGRATRTGAEYSLRRRRSVAAGIPPFLGYTQIASDIITFLVRRPHRCGAWHTVLRGARRRGALRALDRAGAFLSLAPYLTSPRPRPAICPM